MADTITRTYRGSPGLIDRQRLKDAGRLAVKGYRVKAERAEPSKRHARYRLFTLGLVALLIPAPSKKIVTYTRR